MYCAGERDKGKWVWHLKCQTKTAVTRLDWATRQSREYIGALNFQGLHFSPVSRLLTESRLSEIEIRGINQFHVRKNFSYFNLCMKLLKYSFCLSCNNLIKIELRLKDINEIPPFIIISINFAIIYNLKLLLVWSSSLIIFIRKSTFLPIRDLINYILY